jgi:hypothetical protein
MVPSCGRVLQVLVMPKASQLPRAYLILFIPTVIEFFHSAFVFLLGILAQLNKFLIRRYPSKGLNDSTASGSGESFGGETSEKQSS